MESTDRVELLRALVEAHESPEPKSGAREPILYIKTSGGSLLKHHALDTGHLPAVDDALLEEMSLQGVIDIDYLERSWLVVPTLTGRKVIESLDRAENETPLASLSAIQAAVMTQSNSSNKFAWSVVRPILAATKDYWEEAGFSKHGVALTAIREGLPEDSRPLFAATIRSLGEGDYLSRKSDLEIDGLPAEVGFTDRAHTVLDGWPGAGPEDLFENLIAVLKSEADSTPDPQEKKKFDRMIETLRDLGVATAGEVLAKVATGGL